MNKLALTFLCISVLFLSSCTTTDSGKGSDFGGTTPVENALPYIKPAVILACTVVLEQALSPEDRVEKAKMINNVSTVVESLTIGKTPTPDQLQKALMDYLPTEKTHWAKYIIALKDIYAAQFAKINGDAALAVKVLNAIASGCKEATEEYVD
ncbi:MAG: hypothetical protein EBU90_08310 [Proteobacteria bacterium]|nr:hypothetical protein [Pseudomonadota bacterium]